MSSIGVIRSSGWAAATRFSVAPRLECSLPIATIVSFQLRPTISLFKSATTFASGTVGCSEKNWLPHRPRSSPLTEVRSEEHTSELQSRSDLVCRLLLEKKKKYAIKINGNAAGHTIQQV